jgi:hypothetical protein
MVSAAHAGLAAVARVAATEVPINVRRFMRAFYSFQGGREQGFARKAEVRPDTDGPQFSFLKCLFSEWELRSSLYDAWIVGARHKSEESALVHKLTRHGILDEIRSTQEAALKM